MKSLSTSNVNSNQWGKLRQFTSARIALGRAGSSLPTHELLKFQLEHAQARDAVHLSLDTHKTYRDLRENLLTYNHNLFMVEPALLVQSKAVDRQQYLQRPDLGRVLNESSETQLKRNSGYYDLAICVVDGLSSLAVTANVGAFLESLLPKISHLNLAPLVVAKQGRVALGDHIAQSLGAKSVLLLIGERPGLLSPDSLGVYLTYGPFVGTNDAMRNCISNIRIGGLTYSDAAIKAQYLINESIRLGFSGVDLKERVAGEESMLCESVNFLINVEPT
ncbi:ethanolamine ammonia-lyase subunit EutC [Oceaniserpentilla sp. 4NH20-0058]|uniref:ethanolamine ammonia-lyase subunit EutC n=1 Tax=Oceaniserpentilla sp. 4NH20-0058 TaxID=3127660 RepID=UPI00310ACB0A